MAGTKAGGQKAAATNKARHGANFYAKIGRKGGQNGKTGGFADSSETAQPSFVNCPLIMADQATVIAG